jgi:hypothetical protein
MQSCLGCSNGEIPTLVVVPDEWVLHLHIEFQGFRFKQAAVLQGKGLKLAFPFSLTKQTTTYLQTSRGINMK